MDVAAKTEAPWLGRAHMSLGWAVFLGMAGDNRVHAHHALQIIVSLGAPVSLWTQSGTVVVSGAVVPSNILHALLPSHTELGLLYLDRESNAGRESKARLV